MPSQKENIPDARDRINGALLIYNHPLLRNATTIMEHVNAFAKHSRFRIWSINTELGFPRGLGDMRFRVILLHYSLFGIVPYQLGRRFLDYLRRDRGSYKIAFFQDEYYYCIPRYNFLNTHHIDMVYTLLEPRYFQEVYGKRTSVRQFRNNITGYVSDELIAKANCLSLPDEHRTIDIGYRGRRLSYWLGKAAQEKHWIGVEFAKRSRPLGLRLNISSDERKRIYGDDWYRFMGRCKAMLGVEAGVELFDIQDECRTACRKLIAGNVDITFEEVWDKVLHKYEGNIFHRVIGPRVFEAAACRTCQILFEGKYSGILQPMVHYIPLRKDFSNFDEVIERFRDKALRRELTENAYRDLIASGRYSYRRFIEGIDRALAAAGLEAGLDEQTVQRVTKGLNQGLVLPRIKAWAKYVRYYDFPGRGRIVSLLKGIRFKLSRLGQTGVGRKDIDS